MTARIPDRVWGIAAVLVGALAVGVAVWQDWVPLDEGTILLPARYVADGWLPHRDFAYPYTGGLAFLGALTVKLFGDTMLAARWVLFAAFAAWLVAVWALARRNCSAPVSSVAVLLAAFWSILMYPAALPTWYVLFLTTAASLSLARWEQMRGTGSLFVAGLCCGAAIVLKQTGLYTLVGAGLGVLAIRQQRSAQRANPVVPALLAVALVVPGALMFQRGPVSSDALQIALPMAAVFITLWMREVRSGSGPARELFRAWGVLIAGAAILPLLLVAAYAMRGGLGALIAGLGAGSLRTANFIARPMPSLAVVMAHAAVPLLVATALALIPKSRAQLIASLVAAAAALYASYSSDPGYRAVWHFATLTVPVGAFTFAWLERRRRDAPGSASPAVIAAATVMLALNQYPLANPNYFGYVAPMAFLLVAVLASRAGVSARLLGPAALLVIYGGWFHRIGDVGTLAYGPVWRETSHVLASPHGGIGVAVEDSLQYSRLVDLVRAHGGPDSLAGGPEMIGLYALSGTRRVLKQPYLLVDEANADSTALARSFDVAAIRAIAIQHAPIFLPQVRPDARAWLVARYPNQERLGNIEFRWR